MRKILSLLLSIIMLLSMSVGLDFSAFAEMLANGKCGDNVYYSFDSSTGTLTISGNGEMNDYFFHEMSDPTDWTPSPFWGNESIKRVIVENGVTSIGDYSFRNCKNIINISLSQSILEIGGGAFYNCTGLTSITLPKNLKYINYNAFYLCTALSNLDIPDSVTKLGNDAFYRCTGLTDVTIGSGLTNAGGCAFWKCENLKNVIIRDGVKEIGYGMFADCTSLSNIVIPDSVIKINNIAFSNCKSLKSVTIGKGLLNIGNSAFNNCTELKYLFIPNNVSNIENKAFNGTSSDFYILCPKGSYAETYAKENNIKYLIYNTVQGWIKQDSFDKWGYSDYIYVNSDGTLATGWLKLNNKWYYFDENGFMQRGIIEISGKNYWFKPDGSLIDKTGVYNKEILDVTKLYHWGRSDEKVNVVVDNYTFILATRIIGIDEANELVVYSLEKNIKDGWNKLYGKWYYLTKYDTNKYYSSGSASIVSIDNTHYAFNQYGQMQTGWVKLDFWSIWGSSTEWCYAESSGALVTGWKKIGGTWYHFGSDSNSYDAGLVNHCMDKGWQMIGSTWYYFKSSGAMVTGWQKIGGTWYYFKSSGAMQIGWLKDGGSWYFFNNSGAMVTGWVKSGGSWYYMDSSGAMLANTSKKIGGKTYKFNGSGVCTNP